MIDPVLSYSTFIGGSEFDMPLEIAVDDLGNAYIVGTTPSSEASFPITAGVVQGTFAGPGNAPGDPLPIVGGDAFVAKLSPAGDTLVWATYLGGSASDYGRGIAVDGDYNVYVSGETDSNNFPTTPGSLQPAFGGGGADGFVTKLDVNGANLLYSTYLGGTGGDEAFRIAVDVDHNAYVVGNTTSTDGVFVPGNLNGANATIAGSVDACDNCPAIANADQLDTDQDGIGDACDNCPAVANPDQADENGNGIGNACDEEEQEEEDECGNCGLGTGQMMAVTCLMLPLMRLGRPRRREH